MEGGVRVVGFLVMCEDKEEVRGAGAPASPQRLCWARRPPAPLPDTRGLCCAKLLRKNGKPKKVSAMFTVELFIALIICTRRGQLARFITRLSRPEIICIFTAENRCTT